MTSMSFTDDEASSVANALRSAAARYEEFTREAIPELIKAQFRKQVEDVLRLAARFELECGV